MRLRFLIFSLFSLFSCEVIQMSRSLSLSGRVFCSVASMHRRHLLCPLCTRCCELSWCREHNNLSVHRATLKYCNLYSSVFLVPTDNADFSSFMGFLQFCVTWHCPCNTNIRCSDDECLTQPLPSLLLSLLLALTLALGVMSQPWLAHENDSRILRYVKVLCVGNHSGREDLVCYPLL